MGGYLSVPFVGHVTPNVVVEPSGPEVKNGVWISKESEQDKVAAVESVMEPVMEPPQTMEAPQTIEPVKEPVIEPPQTIEAPQTIESVKEPAIEPVMETPQTIEPVIESVIKTSHPSENHEKKKKRKK
jgi:hypothetical protein